MIFDVTIVFGSNYSLEYDANGGIIEKGEVVTSSFIVPDSKVGEFSVIKDPIVDHINLYSLELFDIPLDIIGLFKANSVKCIIIRLGSGIFNGLKNFDFNKVFIKPVQMLEQSIQPDGVQNDIIIKGISLTANAMLMDSSFSSELQEVKSYADSQSIIVGKSSSNVDYSTTAGPIPAGKDIPVNVLNYNPGNIIDTSIQWAGVVDNNGSRFEKFATPELGFRALALNLKSKINQGNVTLAQIISVWAPRHENNTGAYQQFMSKSTGLNLNDPVSEKDFANLAKAISWYEGDNKVGYFTDEMINAGIKMAGFDSTVNVKLDKSSMTKSSYGYGTGTPPNAAAGTNVNSSINVYNNIKGSTVLENILNRLKEKYKIEVAVDAMVGIIKSNFLYKNINFTGSTTFEVLKQVHKMYPAYYTEVPWILDDMRYPDGSSKVGKTWYTELGLLDINSLPVRNLKDTFNGGTAVYTYVTAEAPRKYYTESMDRINAKTIVFKELPTGIETVFKAESTMELVSVPNTNIVNETNSSVVSIDKIKINSHKLVNIEAGYSAEEFKKRYDIFKKHVYSNPSIVRIHIRCDNPNLIEFGYAYTFDELGLNKITPLKIKMKFKNIENKYQLDYIVDFYKGINITQS